VKTTDSYRAVRLKESYQGDLQRSYQPTGKPSAAPEPPHVQSSTVVPVSNGGNGSATKGTATKQS